MLGSDMLTSASVPAVKQTHGGSGPKLARTTALSAAGRQLFTHSAPLDLEIQSQGVCVRLLGGKGGGVKD